MSDPYLLDLPAVVCFSGGRTSGYMLRHILDAHGGQPDGLKVCFQNTGLEHPVTYDFVEECGKRWGVDIVWLEYCTDDENNHAFEIVGPDTASKNGEPFDALIAKKGYLPNPVSRICTTNLKMRTLDRYLKTFPKFEGGYTNAVGLRADEPRRVSRLKADNGREEMTCPLSRAGVDEAAVLAWWSKQDFDLMLPEAGNMAGNCVGCFLKNKAKLEILMYSMPEHFEWWIKTEQGMAGKATTRAGEVFQANRPTYDAMMRTVNAQGRLPFGGVLPGKDDSVSCFCTD